MGMKLYETAHPTRGQLQPEPTNMNNNHSTATKSFFKVADEQTKNMVIAAIAIRYGITTEQSLEKVTNEKSKSLLDYLKGPVRSAIALTMRSHGITP
jgi:hypothetical protein